MAAPTIADYMKYADLQMAAEALYEFNAKKNAATLVPGDQYFGPINELWLTDGNLHASKFTATDAKNFAAEWTVVDHISNTTTGFSGTLFQNKKGELVLSFRSTEFLDDAARDNQATNVMEIKEHGWAFGQIADMENWYRDLRQPGGPLESNKHFSVTGYSLGGHLATAFNLMHNGDALIDQVVTFNGAGVGKIDSANDNLGSVISAFDILRKNADGQSFLFQNADLNTLYADFRHTISGGNPPSTQDFAALDSLVAPVGASSAEIDRLAADKARVRNAMERVRNIQTEITRLRGITDSSDGNLAEIPTSQIEQLNLDYQMAVLTVSERTTAMPMLIGGLNLIPDRKALDNPYFTNQYDVVGKTTPNSPSMVSYSQWHHGQDVGVFIEDQPQSRGTVVWDSIQQSWIYKDFKLLVNGYTENDFGDTHSLVLIADALRVQELLGKLDPKATVTGLNSIFTLASGLKAKGKFNSQGEAEGDAVETVLNALADMLLDPNEFTRLKGNPKGNTWAEINAKDKYTGRNEFAALVEQIAKALDGSAMLDSTTVAASTADLKNSARQDFGSFIALYTLSPFVLKGDYVETPLKGVWKTVFDGWNADKNLSAEERANGKASYSDQWFANRGELMRYWLKAHSDNITKVDKDGNATSNVVANSLPATDIWRYVDIEHKETINVGAGIGANEPLDPSKILHIVEFGDKQGNTMEVGDGDSRLYGMDGIDIDILTGGNQADNLEGGAGRSAWHQSAIDRFGTDRYIAMPNASRGGRPQIVPSGQESSGVVNLSRRGMECPAWSTAPNTEWRKAA